MSYYLQIIMTKWYTVSGRFSDKEKAFIESWEKRTGISDNHLVRTGVQLVVGLSGIMELLEKPDLAPIKQYAEEIQKTLNSPKLKKELDKAGERWISRFKEEQIKKWEEEAKKFENELKVFDEKRKRGRPEADKTRGRPKK